jgi:hypothetical protein
MAYGSFYFYQVEKKTDSGADPTEKVDPGSDKSPKSADIRFLIVYRIHADDDIVHSLFFKCIYWFFLINACS